MTLPSSIITTVPSFIFFFFFGFLLVDFTRYIENTLDEFLPLDKEENFLLFGDTTLARTNLKIETFTRDPSLFIT